MNDPQQLDYRPSETDPTCDPRGRILPTCFVLFCIQLIWWPFYGIWHAFDRMGKTISVANDTPDYVFMAMPGMLALAFAAFELRGLLKRRDATIAMFFIGTILSLAAVIGTFCLWYSEVWSKRGGRWDWL